MKTNEYIKQRRIELGLTQLELSKYVGMSSAQHLCNVENGKAPMPYKYYKKLAKKLKINRDDFLDILLSDYRTKLEKYL